MSTYANPRDKDVGRAENSHTNASRGIHVFAETDRDGQPTGEFVSRCQSCGREVIHGEATIPHRDDCPIGEAAADNLESQAEAIDCYPRASATIRAGGDRR